MLLDPVNAITSVNFYRKIAGQAIGRTLLYLAYLSLVFAIASTAAMKIKVGPEIDKAFAWLSQSMPTLTLQGGKASSSAAGPVTLQYPEIPEIAFTIDTSRTEPIAPDLLETNKILAYLTATTLYVRTQQPGRPEVLDLSKAASGKPVVIDAAFYLRAGRILTRILYPTVFVLGLGFTFGWKIAAALIYSLIALMINAIAETGQPYEKLFTVSAYAQTLVVAIQAIFMFMPVAIPGFTILSLIITGVYIWLALKRLNEPAPAAAA